MSTRTEHLRREREQRLRYLRRAREIGARVYNVVRPFLMVGLAYLGSWMVANELGSAPWHHNTPVWVLGFFVAGSALYSLFKDLRARLRFRRWERTKDPDRVRDGAKEVRKLLRRLPPWFALRYKAKVLELE